MVQILSTNTFTAAKWIVSPATDPTQGTHTTIAAALTSASSGDTILIRDGTYTENLSLKAGVDLCALGGDQDEPNVTIVGKCTFSSTGTCTISNIRLQTNSDFILAVTGSAASIVNIDECNLNCTNNTGISFTTTNTSALIKINNCTGNLGTTGITYFAHSSTGTMNIQNGMFSNTGGSTTPSTCSGGGVLNTNSCQFVCAMSLSSSSGGTFSRTAFEVTNTTVITTSGTVVLYVEYCRLNSGSAIAINIGSLTTVTCYFCEIGSSHANYAVDGAGTFVFGGIVFSSTQRILNATTQSALNSGTFTPSLAFGGGTTGLAYTTRLGEYYRMDNAIFFSVLILTSSKGSSTGAATITGFPFSNNTSTSNNNGFVSASGITNTASYTQCSYYFSPGTIMSLSQNGSGQVIANLTDANFANATQIALSGVYFTS